MPVFLASLASALLGLGDFFGGMGGRRVARAGGTVSIAWVASCAGAAAAGIYVAVFPPVAVSASDLMWMLIAIPLVSVIRPLLYLGMEIGPMAVFSAVLGVMSLVLPAIVGPLTGDILSPSELAGVLIAIPAVLLIVSEGRLPSVATIGASSALVLGIIVGGLIGCMSVIFGQISPDAGAMPAFLTQLGAVAGIPLLSRLPPMQTMAPLTSEVRRFGVLIGLIDVVAIISSVIAFQRGDIAVVAAILGFAPGVTILLAWRVYEEAVRRWQWAGAGLATVSIVLFAAAA